MLYLSIGKALIACVVECMNFILVGFSEVANGRELLENICEVRLGAKCRNVIFSQGAKLL